jgi:hypothetical protein
VPFVIEVKRKQLMKSSLETKECESFTTRNVKKESLLKVAVIACVNKLLHWIFALLKNKTTFQDID